eukprot:CAMPEP_0194585832 /NCGR_PEP_ID=MMETSP0292-20121207/18022_1 /TAXON_ID=39354 /ORGANISM="Heterosigma akashiwo, Strain CCMP2393" /LENGTH=318 /DNA_ID=CAMNT_0039441425 /DNA_START=81 /DNA_END=1037 /DNA_ORIENTATION=+
MEVFTEQILTKYFRHSKFLSFTRQLNLYGFRKVITCGPDEWAYEHKCFLRDRPDLLDFVRRTLAPASKGKVPAPEEEAANVRRKLAPASKGKVPAPEEEAAKEQPPTSQPIQFPGTTLQSPSLHDYSRLHDYALPAFPPAAAAYPPGLVTFPLSLLFEPNKTLTDMNLSLNLLRQFQQSQQNMQHIESLLPLKLERFERKVKAPPAPRKPQWCTEDGCSRLPMFGPAGQKPVVCSAHRKEGMFNVYEFLGATPAPAPTPEGPSTKTSPKASPRGSPVAKREVTPCKHSGCSDPAACKQDYCTMHRLDMLLQAATSVDC